MEQGPSTLNNLNGRSYTGVAGKLDFSDEQYDGTPDLKSSKWSKRDTRSLLALVAKLSPPDDRTQGVDWTAAELERVVESCAAERAGGKVGKVAQPIRIAVSGGTISPPIYDTLLILGRDRSLKRIRRCLDARAELTAGAAS